jgi:hypothetical protein
MDRLRFDLWLSLSLVLCLAACRTTATSSPSLASDDASPSTDTPSAGPSAPQADRVTLLGGAHYVTSRDGIGWILSKPSENGILALTRLDLDSGNTATNVIDDGVEYTPNSPILSADEAGHLWFTYYRQLLRIDQESGAIRRWDPPAAPIDAAPSDEHPEAGQLMSNAWDTANGTLLFLRNVDHRLYQFNPATEVFSSVADLPIVTHSFSRVSVDNDGRRFAINGGLLGATTFSPTAAILGEDASTLQVIPDALSVCIDSAGVATMDQAGGIRMGDRLLGQVGFHPDSDVVLVCDGLGHVFSVGGVIRADDSAGELVIYRFSMSGMATVSLPLTRSTGFNRYTGEPYTVWGGVPSAEYLLPDGQGGVWLVSVDGTSSTPEVGDSPYPTLMRIRF